MRSAQFISSQNSSIRIVSSIQGQTDQRGQWQVTAGRERTAGGRRWTQSDGGQTKGGRRPDTSIFFFLQKKKPLGSDGGGPDAENRTLDAKNRSFGRPPAGKKSKRFASKKKVLRALWYIHAYYTISLNTIS